MTVERIPIQHMQPVYKNNEITKPLACLKAMANKETKEMWISKEMWILYCTWAYIFNVTTGWDKPRALP